MALLENKNGIAKMKKTATTVLNEAPAVADTKETKADTTTKNDPSEMTRPLLIVLGTVALLVTLIYIYPFVVSLFGMQREVFTNVEQLGQRHLDLEQKVKEMQKIQETHVTLPNYMDLIQRVEALEAKQQTLEKAVVTKSVEAIAKADPKTSETIQKLQERLDQMEGKIASRQDRITKLPSAIGLFEKLRDRMEDDKPFEKALKDAMPLFDPKDESMQKRLKDMANLAVTGVASMNDLSVGFRLVAKDIRRLSIPVDATWYEKMQLRMRNLVVVRKQGDALTGDASNEDRIARIQHLIEAWNLEDALKEMQRFDGLDSAEISEWKAHASSRLFIQQSIPIMEAHVLAYLISGDSENSNTVRVEKTKGE